MEAKAAQFAANERVTVVNTSRDDLNGQLGTIDSYDGDKDRFNVCMDSGQVMALKAVNLQKGSAAAASPVGRVSRPSATMAAWSN